MAVSKRTRYEVLRRDNHACRYCGASAPDAKLTVDHVMPVALGGGDDPTNLVTACRDCNAGKSSSAPDDPLVADVASDALRWQQAMRVAMWEQRNHRAKLDAQLEHFRHSWDAWTTKDGETVALPTSWRSSVERLIGAGIAPVDMDPVIEEVMTSWGVQDEFRLFMHKMYEVLDGRMALARRAIDEGRV